MSTATIPFQLRRGPFPFCANEADDTAPDYVVLDETDGDEGLAEAMRLWWMLEKVSFTPTGSANDGEDSYAFTKVFTAPEPDTTDLTTYELRGAVTGQSLPITAPAFTSKQPALRACTDGGGTIISTQIFYEYSIGDQEFGRFALIISYTSGRWRLNYQFSFQRGDVQVCAPGTNNPSASPVVATGTVSLGGYDLNWEGRELDSLAPPTGYGLTLTADFWAF